MLPEHLERVEMVIEPDEDVTGLVCIAEEITEAQYLQVDESPIQVLNTPDKTQRKNKKIKTSGGKSHRGYQWVYLDVDANLVLFDYQKGRGREGPTDLLQSFKGYLQTDGYAVYEQYDAHRDITLLGCMAHARRYFVNAQSSDPNRAGHFLAQVQQLYDLERQLKESQVDAGEIFLASQTKAISILAIAILNGHNPYQYRFAVLT